MGLGDLMGLMRDFGSLRQKLAEIQGDLERERIEGEAGGGMVRVTVNGRQELLDLTIDPQIVSRDDLPLLQDMVKGAVGQALAKARDKQREAMAKLLGGVPLPPGLLEMLG